MVERDLKCIYGNEICIILGINIQSPQKRNFPSVIAML